jgi:hypothetical protein
MYAHVQSQLEAYKVLKKQYIKPVEIINGKGHISISKYQQSKIDEEL